VIGDRWGVTDAEVERPYPCDEWVPNPRLQAWRGVSVDAPAERVWPWVAQIRVAPYSYDWIDNLGRRSPRSLLDLPDPVVGEPFTTAAGTRQLGRILSVEPGRQLTGRIAGAVMSYVVRSRLLLKIVMATHPIVATLLSAGDLVMARRQLITLRRLAEDGGQRA
jgi:hypothetical protein